MSQNTANIEQTLSLKKQENPILITLIGKNHLVMYENKMSLINCNPVKKKIN